MPFIHSRYPLCVVSWCLPTLFFFSPVHTHTQTQAKLHINTQLAAINGSKTPHTASLLFSLHPFTPLCFCLFYLFLVSSTKLCLFLIPIFKSIILMLKSKNWKIKKRTKIPSHCVLLTFMPLYSLLLWSLLLILLFIWYIAIHYNMQSNAKLKGLLLALCGAPSPPPSRYLLLLLPLSHTSKSGSKI